MQKILLLFSIIIAYTNKADGQWQINNKAPIPYTTSNCATVGWGNSVYVFGSIDSALTSSNIHQRSIKYNTITNSYTILPTIPDTLGKLAASASVINNIVYLIGGYYVYANGAEKSSSLVHRFDLNANTFLPNATNVPIPIDDHVQAVWRDSLIYVVTGWSNTTNVPNVQIYNPSSNSWQVGTNVPNNNFYKCFGANGIIVKDTIYYYGGASNGTNFPNTNYLRKGVIDPANPTSITWSYQALTGFAGYRCATLYDSVNKAIVFAGGSNPTYNYNGVAYNGSGLATCNQYALVYKLDGTYYKDSFATGKYLRDYRTIAHCSNNKWYLAGGITDSGAASNAMLEMYYAKPNILVNALKPVEAALYPNPCNNSFTVQNLAVKSVAIYSVWGNKIACYIIGNTVYYTAPAGLYFVHINNGKMQSIINTP